MWSIDVSQKKNKNRRACVTARRREGQAIFSFTSTLPRVALEYGQT